MNVAILGCGTVGTGCIEALKGSKAKVKKILDLRTIPGYEDITTQNIGDILEDDSIVTVAELMGGEHPAYDFVKSALLAGKNVVTANKHMLSLHFEELSKLAEENNVQLLYSAAAGGGIPWLPNLKRIAATGKIAEIGGVMNGTTNYILDQMQSCGKSYSEALKEAQELGYAEADPTADVEGLDVRAKLAISCNVAWGGQLDPIKIPTEGITGITGDAVEKAKAEGRVIRLIAKAWTENGEIKTKIAPEAVDESHPAYSLKGAENLFYLVGENSGTISFKGMGAGKKPTGANVAADILETGKNYD